jgi:hypothetical protein
MGTPKQSTQHLFRWTMTAECSQEWVEIKFFVHTQANASDIRGSIAAATASSAGGLTSRGGNRDPIFSDAGS